MDLAELARKRWIEKWTIPRIAKHFDRSPETIQMYICQFRKGKFESLKLNSKEKAQIKPILFEVFNGS